MSYLNILLFKQKTFDFMCCAIKKKVIVLVLSPWSFTSCMVLLMLSTCCTHVVHRYLNFSCRGHKFQFHFIIYKRFKVQGKLAQEPVFSLFLKTPHITSVCVALLLVSLATYQVLKNKTINDFSLAVVGSMLII